MNNFKVGDKVVPRLPHPWNDICCVVLEIKEDQYLVTNGRGESQLFDEHKLDHLCDAVHEYVCTQILVDPKLREKTIWIKK